MKKALDLESAGKEPLHLSDPIRRYCQVQIQTNQGIGIGVNTLSADHTVTDLMLFEHAKQLLQEVCPVHNHRFPERKRLHAATSLHTTLPS